MLCSRFFDKDLHPEQNFPEYPQRDNQQLKQLKLFLENILSE